MTKIEYPAVPYHRLKRQQLLTLAIALEDQRDEVIGDLEQVKAVLGAARRVAEYWRDEASEPSMRHVAACVLTALKSPESAAEVQRDLGIGQEPS